MIHACAHPARVEAGPISRPAYLAPIVDSTLGSVITRLSNDTGTSTAPVPGVWGADARHVYSTQQPWNSDQTLLSIENRGGGSPSPLILDGTTYVPRHPPCPNYEMYDYRWHPGAGHPREQINVNASGTELMWFDVTTCTKTRTWALPIVPDYGMGSGAGNPSADGRFVAVGNEVAMVVIDMDPQPPHAPYPNKRIGPVYAFPPCSLETGSETACHISNLSISPSGRFIDVKYSGATALTADMHRIYEVDPTTLVIRPHAMADSSLRCGTFASRPNGWIFPLKHSDMTRNPFDGNEDVIVGGRSCPGSPIGRVVMVRLRDGKVTPLTDPTDEAPFSHASTRNLRRPGWVYVSYFPDGALRFSDEIVAVKLDGSGEVERYAHQRNITSGCYRCESHPVPSPDGRRVLFASNWARDCGDGCGGPGDIKDYVATLPGGPAPGPIGFGFESVRPNPATGPPVVVFALDRATPADLDLVDIAGRRLFRTEVPGAPGRYVISVNPGFVPPAGIYLLRLSQAGRHATAKVVFLQ